MAQALVDTSTRSEDKLSHFDCFCTKDLELLALFLSVVIHSSGYCSIQSSAVVATDFHSRTLFLNLICRCNRERKSKSGQTIPPLDRC